MRQPRTSGLLIAIMVVMCFCVGAVATVRVNLEDALDTSVSLSQGGARSVVTVRGSSSELSAALARAGLQPVRMVSEQLGNSSDPSRSNTPIPVREIVAGSAPGRLIEGRQSSGPGEAVVSRALALRLGAVISSQVHIADLGDATVVGIQVDPLSPASELITLRVKALDTQRATFWLDPSAESPNPQLAAISDQLVSVNVPTSFGDQNSNPLSSALHALTAAALVGAFLTGAVAAVVLNGLWQASRRRREALMAAGFSRRRAGLVLHLAWGGAMFVGLIAGTALSTVAQLVLTKRVGELFGQYWSGVNVPTSGIALLFILGLATPLTCSIVVTSFTPFARWRRRITPATIDRARAGVWIIRVLGGVGAVTLLALAVLAIAVGISRRPLNIALDRVLFIGPLALLVLPPLQQWVVGHGFGPRTRHFLDVINSRFKIVSVLQGVLFYLAFGWGLTVARTAADNTSDSASSTVLQVVNVRADQAHSLEQLFASVGGKDARIYPMLLDSDVSPAPLAASRGMISCLQRALPSGRGMDSCNDGSLTTVVLNPYQPTTVQTPVTFGKSSHIGLVWTNSLGTASRTLAATSQSESSTLADEASVVLIGTNTRLAHQAQLKASELDFVVLPGFDALPRNAKAQLRSALFTNYPSAFPQSNTNSADTDSLRSLGNAVAGTTAVVMALTLMLVVSASRQFHSRDLAISHSLGGLHFRARLRTYPWQLLLLTGAVVTGITDLSWWLGLPHTGNGLTEVSLLPLLLVAAASLATAWQPSVSTLGKAPGRS